MAKYTSSGNTDTITKQTSGKCREYECLLQDQACEQSENSPGTRYSAQLLAHLSNTPVVGKGLKTLDKYELRTQTKRFILAYGTNICSHNTKSPTPHFSTGTFAPYCGVYAFSQSTKRMPFVQTMPVCP
jgi:hypothetical protein